MRRDSRRDARRRGSAPFCGDCMGWAVSPRVFDITQAFIGFGLLGATPYQILHHVAGGILGARFLSDGMDIRCNWFCASLHDRVHSTATIQLLGKHAVSCLCSSNTLFVCRLLYGEAVFYLCTLSYCHFRL